MCIKSVINRLWRSVCIFAMEIIILVFSIGLSLTFMEGKGIVFLILVFFPVFCIFCLNLEQEAIPHFGIRRIGC